MMKWLVNEESGQGMVEYGLILALISITCIVILGKIGDASKKQFTAVESALDGASSTP